jgi:hypothetical protein
MEILETPIDPSDPKTFAHVKDTALTIIGHQVRVNEMQMRTPNEEERRRERETLERLEAAFKAPR